MKSKMNLIALFVVIVAGFVNVQAQWGWGSGNNNQPTEQLVGKIKVGALREVDPTKPGVYKPFDGETIELGLYVKKNNSSGYIPSDVQAFNSFQVTDGLCQGTPDEQAICRNTLYNLGGTFWLPKGGYSVTIRPIPGQGKRIVQTHLNTQFRAGVPEGSVSIDRRIGFSGPAEKNIAVMHFGAFEVKSLNNDVGHLVNGERIWGVTMVTSLDSETFGFCYGTWPLPVAVYNGAKFNMNPNHAGNYLQPVGFQNPTVWARIKPSDRQGRDISVSANLSNGLFASTMMIHINGVVVEDN